MPDVLFIFKVHQPHRLKKGFFWERRLFRRLTKDELFNHYFDTEQNRELFNRAAKKCYFPANNILLEAIDRFRKEKKKAKVSFSISGVFFEQCESFNPDLLETFKHLAATGCVEFLDQPYYHSLVGLYPDRTEFVDQIRMHRELIKSLFKQEPAAFENTELLYNNAVAKAVDKLGYSAIFTEGVDRILKGRSANYVYRAKDCNRLRVLLRNFKLTDDIGFRFSLKTWSDYPLTADKYARWLSEEQGNVVTIFPDYETFGEHHWPETGIHDFLRHLPVEVLKMGNLGMATPSEVVTKHSAVGEIDVGELGGTVSWADTSRDTSGWLGNTMQWAYYTTTKELEPLVKESEDAELLRLWRCFLISDHLYYMFTAGGGPGEVHTYFSPYESPMNAFVTAEGAALDFETKVRSYTIAANEPFLFFRGDGEDSFTGVKAWSLKGISRIIKSTSVHLIEFHNQRDDFEKWARLSLRDKVLGEVFHQIRESDASGEKLRNMLYEAISRRFEELKLVVLG